MATAVVTTVPAEVVVIRGATQEITLTLSESEAAELITALYNEDDDRRGDALAQWRQRNPIVYSVHQAIYEVVS